ncbi:MAG: ABC transporter permease, partial [Actinomycetota bacterium]
RPGKRQSIGILAKYGIVIAWIAEIAIFASIEPSSFFSASNFKEIASSQADLVILALAVVPTLAVGEVDLSIASVMALSATLFGRLNGTDHHGVGLALAVAVVAALLTGLVSGLITVYLRVRGIIVTLGMGTLVLGVTTEVSHSLTVGGISLSFQNAMNHQIFGVSYAFYYAVAVVFILWYVFRHTPAGRWMLFLGFNREVARLSGIDVSRLRLLGFVLGSFIAGLAGIVSIGVAGGADPSSFQPLLLPAFAASFLGSLIFTPGRVNSFGSFVALYFLATGVVGIQLLGVGSWIDDAFYGGALVITVALSGLSELLGLRVRKVKA